MYQRDILTTRQSEMIGITMVLEEVLKESNIKNGVMTIFVPHTTAGITINENTDPDVASDMLEGLEKLIPYYNNYKHVEGNSAAHLKSSIMGSSVSVIVQNGKLQLGSWQGIYFCEFDGPRKRRVYIDIR